jgi:hypothetical protein
VTVNCTFSSVGDHPVSEVEDHLRGAAFGAKVAQEWSADAYKVTLAELFYLFLAGPACRGIRMPVEQVWRRRVAQSLAAWQIWRHANGEILQ